MHVIIVKTPEWSHREWLDWVCGSEQLRWKTTFYTPRVPGPQRDPPFWHNANHYDFHWSPALSLFNRLFTRKMVHTCSGVNPGTSSDSRLEPLWFQIRSRSIWHTLSHIRKKQRKLLKEEYHSPRLWLRPRVEADAVNIREIKAILDFYCIWHLWKWTDGYLNLQIFLWRQKLMQ